ncbi:MAG: MarR family transcriptional regulator [Solirubrobacterales bacterium]|jgi:DNA-binding MarR family transcriptional regulator
MPADQPQPNLGILLREPYRIASERLHERFAESGHPEVRAPHGNVFAFLDHGGTRVSELARRAQITKQSMGELVAHLERNGYVERVPDPDDRRAKLVRSTARGSELYAIARRFVAEVEAEWTERLGQRKMGTLRELLVELNAGLRPEPGS